MSFILRCQASGGDSSEYELIEGGIYLCGKSLSVDIHIPDELVSRQHARLLVKRGMVLIEDLNSTNGILLNGVLLKSKSKTDVEGDDVIKLGNSTLTLLVKKSEDLELESVNSVIDPKPVINSEHLQPSKNISQVREQNMQAEVSDNNIEKIAFKNLKFTQDDFEFIKSLHTKTLEHMDLYKRSILHKLSPEELRVEAEESVQEVLKSIDKNKLQAQISQAELVELVVAEAVGLGPLEPLLEDDSISEIMVNGFDKIYTEKSGKIFKIDMRFNSNASLMSIIERIVTPIGRRVDEGSPMVDGRLKDGSRVNAIIPPLSLIGPTLTIRKFGKHRFSIDDLVNKETMSDDMAKFLEIAVKFRKNMIVSGGTGSGKTTTLNVISNFIPASERIVTIEDAAELRLNQDHVISLESRPKNVEGKGEILIRDLVKNSLRMRPDRIVVGECRGGEALDMLQAMNTGHDGSLTTGHANSPRDLLSRLEVMVLMSGVDLPVRAIREQIASAVDVILQQTRFADGSRRVTSIFVIEGMEGDVILMQKLFEFKQHGIDENGKVVGEYMATGQIPQFYSDLEAGGIAMDRSIFLRNNSSEI